ncbi:MAG: EamA family transporter [Actinomycetota bacterium]|nr:DMT family transporter [Acidimicrobiales bacterium]MEC8977111.1 EamA family transporter [Actinomycetota bacterium]MED6305108.1 EamA family transporter [Actinomycetota bacterium]
MNATSTDQRRGVPAAAIAMVGWAASGVIAKGISELGVFAVVFWRMWIYAFIVLIFLKVRGTPLRKESLRVSWRGGISLGADIMLFFTALRLTTVANATVIGSCQPLIMLLIVGRLFGERPRRRDWGLALVAITGVALVMFGSAGMPGWSPRGDLLSVATVFAWTGYFVFSKLSSRHIESSQYTGATALICALFASPFALASGQVFDMPSSNAWVWLVILSIGPGFASHMLMNWALVRIPAWLGSTLTLGIPVTATVMAWIFLGEDVVAVQFLGMGVVLLALGFIVIGQSKSNETQIS